LRFILFLFIFRHFVILFIDIVYADADDYAGERRRRATPRRRYATIIDIAIRC